MHKQRFRTLSSVLGLLFALAPFTGAAPAQEKAGTKPPQTASGALQGVKEKAQEKAQETSEKKAEKPSGIGGVQSKCGLGDLREKMDEARKARDGAVKDVQAIDKKPAPVPAAQEPAKTAPAPETMQGEREKVDAQRGAAGKPEPKQASSPGGGNARSSANRMAAAIQVHEVRFARLDALAAVYASKGEDGKLARVEALRTREDQRYQAELQTFQDALGDETYKKVLASLRIARKAPAGGAKGRPSPPPKEGSATQPGSVGEETRDAAKEKAAPAPVKRKQEGGR